jgi:hypothetical protein
MAAMARRLEGSRLVWLLLGSLVPLLFVLDWLVDRGSPQDLSLDAQLQVRADGQDPWVLALRLDGLSSRGGLALSGRAPLRTAIYPWLETPFEAEFMLTVGPQLLAAGPGEYEQDFTASLLIRDARRADGLGTPIIPCSGKLSAAELELDGDQLREAELELDLICTSAGDDLRWRSGDERVWTVAGPLRIKERTGRASPPGAPPAPGP